MNENIWQSKSYHKKIFIRVLGFLVAALIIPAYIIFTSISAQAIIPHYAIISNVIGSNTMSILRNGNYVERAGENTRMYKYNDLLMIPNEENTAVKLDFYDQNDTFLGFAIKLEGENNTITHDTFPCTIKNGDIVDI